MKEIAHRIKTPKFTLRDIIEGSVVIQKPAFSLDVENTSLATNGCLLEIGLVFFDLADPSTVGQFPMWNFFPDATNQLLNGGEVDPETMAFWNMQRIEAALDWQKKNISTRQDIFAVADQLSNQVTEFVKGWNKLASPRKIFIGLLAVRKTTLSWNTGSKPAVVSLSVSSTAFRTYVP